MTVALMFVDLQQARHEADYDVGRRFTKVEANDKVREAEMAFDAWKEARHTPEGDAFLLGLLTFGKLRT